MKEKSLGEIVPLKGPGGQTMKVTPQDWFAGVYWWKSFTDGGRHERDEYAPIGKPAEQVLARWWASGSAG